jgi:predicted RNA binding protein YcfA (HicA-like mRNA interferase family)
MSRWPSVKARDVLSALLRIGWTIKRQRGGSHRMLERPDWPDFAFAVGQPEVPAPGTEGQPSVIETNDQ